MNWIRKFTSSPKSVGLPEDDKANLSKSYTVIDKCDKCPVSVYEDVVFNDNLRALIVEGDPPNEVLVMAKMELVTEFAELSGNKQSSKLNGHIRQIYLYQNQIMGYSIAIRCIESERKNDALAYLRESGIFAKDDWSDEMLIKKIIAKIKNQEVRLSEEVKRYEAAIPKEETKSAESYFSQQLIEISKHAGYHITKSIMMSEFALYIKDLQKAIEYEQFRNHTRKGS